MQPAKRIKTEAHQDDAAGIDELDSIPQAQASTSQVLHQNMYLDSVNRKALDFDQDAVCAVTLSKTNVYMCLVDGVMLQGRSARSPAADHAISTDHHVFMHLASTDVFVLPEGYKVDDPSLDDIKYQVDPTFTRGLLDAIDASPKSLTDLRNVAYRPGFLGLNRVRDAAYMNPVFLMLAHVRPLRDVFLLSRDFSASKNADLLADFALFCRRLWSPRRFKAHLSPHQLVHRCVAASAGRFSVTTRNDPAAFLIWLLNDLKRGLKKTHTVSSLFQGQLLANGAEKPFLFLSLDLENVPLFADTRNAVPQVPLLALLQNIPYTIQKTPRYLILHIRRFTGAQSEKNPTIVTFPVTGLTADCLTGTYDLLANINAAPDILHKTLHDADWHIHVRDAARDAWVDIHNDDVRPINATMIPLAETYVQLWQRRDSGEKGRDSSEKGRDSSEKE